MTKKQALFFLILILLLTASLAGLTYFWAKKIVQPEQVAPADTNPAPAQANTNTQVPGPGTPEIDTSNWLTYRNEEYGFEFKYPEGWCVECKGKQSINMKFIEYNKLSEITDFQAPVIKTKEEFEEAYSNFQKIQQKDNNIGGFKIYRGYSAGYPPGTDGFSKRVVFYPSPKQRAEFYIIFLVGDRVYTWPEEKEIIFQIMEDLRNGTLYPEEVQTFDKIISTLKKIE